MIGDYLGRSGSAKRSAAVLFFFFALALAYGVLVLMRPENFLLRGQDYQSHQFFLKSYLAESFQSGRLPLWNPYICAGRPFAADPQTGVFYPPHLLYALLSVPNATTVLVILHLAAAGFFCFLLGRELGLNGFGALISGVVFMFNGFLITRAYVGQLERLEAIAFLPLLFYFVVRADRRATFIAYVWAGVAGAFQLLAGAPQIAWITWLGLGAFVAVQCAVGWRDGTRSLATRAGGLLAALLVTVGIAAIQIVPTMELAGLSNRSEGSLAFSAVFPFAPQRIVHFFYPNLLVVPYLNPKHESACYVGILSLILAWVGVCRYSGRYKWALLFVAFVGVCVMLGDNTPVFPVLYRYLPGLSSFRIPSRAILMVTLCLALFAGMGASTICQGRGWKRARFLGVVTAGALLIAVAQIGLALTQFPDHGLSNWPGVLIPIALAILSGGAILAYRPGWGHWLRPLGLALLCADLFLVGGHLDRYRELLKDKHLPPHSERDILERLSNENTPARFALPTTLARENCGVLASASGVNGFVSLSLDRYYRFVHAMTMQPVPERFTHTPAKDVFSVDNRFPFKVLNVRFSVGRDPNDGAMVMVERDDAVPRAFFVSEYRVLSDDEAVLEAMLQPSFDPLKKVLFDVDPGFAPSSNPNAGKPSVDIVSYAAESIVLRATVDADGFLILSELEYPGWYAFVDGEEVPILRADYLLRAIPLRAGQYDRIEFRYDPRSFQAGLAVTATSAAAVVLLMVIWLVHKRRRAPKGVGLVSSRSPAGAKRFWQAMLTVQALGIILAGLVLPGFLRIHYALAWVDAGQVLAKRGHYRAAVTAHRRALSIEPDLGAAHEEMAFALMKEGDSLGAASYLRNAIRLDPESGRAQRNLGRVLLQLGDTDGALEQFERALELHADGHELRFALAVAWARRGAFEEAARQIGRALEWRGLDPNLFQNMASLWASYGRFANAIEVLREGVGRWPYNPVLLNSLAWHLATCSEDGLRDGRQSVRMAERACRETGFSNARMLMTLAAAYAQSGELELALEMAGRAHSTAERTGDEQLVSRFDAMIRDFSARLRTNKDTPEENDGR